MTSKMKIHDIAGTGYSSSVAGREEPTSTAKQRSWPGRPRKALAALLQHAGLAVVPNLAESSLPPPGSTTNAAPLARPSPSEAHPSPSGAGCPDLGLATAGGHLRHGAPPRDTFARHHRTTANRPPDRCRPRSTAARDKEGPNPLSLARGMEGRHRRRSPGFARRPLPAEEKGGGGKGGRWEKGDASSPSGGREGLLSSV
jgi:hypothetical protein